MSKIQGIKLVTGEELVAKVMHDQEDGRVFVEDPLVLMMSRGKDGGIVVNFMPWTIIAEGAITLESAGIVARYSLPKEVEDNYIRNTTGLQIVSAANAPQILQG